MGMNCSNRLMDTGNGDGDIQCQWFVALSYMIVAYEAMDFHKVRSRSRVSICVALAIQETQCKRIVGQKLAVPSLLVAPSEPHPVARE